MILEKYQMARNILLAVFNVMLLSGCMSRFDRAMVKACELSRKDIVFPAETEPGGKVDTNRLWWIATSIFSL